VISTGLFGMMIGALVCGPLADRFGRKPVLVACSFLFGIGSLLTATATSLQTLVFFRLFTGLGLGGAMPNAIALTSEYAPKRFRATTVMTMFTASRSGQPSEACGGGAHLAVRLAVDLRCRWHSALPHWIHRTRAAAESIRFLV